MSATKNLETKKPPTSISDVEKADQTDGEVSNQLAVEEETVEDDGSYPEGGLKAWLVAGGTAAVLFCTLGYTNSFGVFQTYYMLHQLADESPDNISWIGSTQAFLIFATGAIGGPLFDRYGAWVRSP
jgi:hypothetical protein